MSDGRPLWQHVALLVREERARVKADTSIPDAQRTAQLARLDGIATILAKTAARDTSLLALLAEDAERLDWLRMAQARGRYLGIPTELITPAEAKQVLADTRRALYRILAEDPPQE